MHYKIEIVRKAEKDFKKLPKELQSRIQEAIFNLAVNPRPHNVRKIEGGTNEYRIRIGDYRVVYTIKNKDKIITIYRVRHRKDSYR